VIEKVLPMLRRSAAILFLAIALLVLAGCAAREEKKRPAAGDVVSVLIYRPKSWQVGKATTINVRLRIEGPSVEKAEILRDPEVPHDQPPLITITFLKDADTLKVFDKVPMTPDC
jgi:hypothetical protein